jgi:hypothetical protein
MKKIALIISVTIYGSFFITSCEQPKADPAVMENKIKEAYETKKAEIDAEVTNACETKINDKVKMLQDSIASLSAAQQAVAMAKMQKELAIAQKKAADLAKKNSSTKPSNEKKPINSVDAKLNDRFNKSSEVVKKEAEKKANQTLDDRFNKSTEEIKKEAEKKADDKLKSRF